MRPPGGPGRCLFWCWLVTSLIPWRFFECFECFVVVGGVRSSVFSTAAEVEEEKASRPMFAVAGEISLSFAHSLRRMSFRVGDGRFFETVGFSFRAGNDSPRTLMVESGDARDDRVLGVANLSWRTATVAGVRRARGGTVDGVPGFSPPVDDDIAGVAREIIFEERQFANGDSNPSPRYRPGVEPLEGKTRERRSTRSEIRRSTMSLFSGVFLALTFVMSSVAAFQAMHAMAPRRMLSTRPLQANMASVGAFAHGRGCRCSACMAAKSKTICRRQYGLCNCPACAPPSCPNQSP